METSEQPQGSMATSEKLVEILSRAGPKSGQSALGVMPDLSGILREAEILRQGLEAAIRGRVDDSDQTVQSIGHKDSGRIPALFWKASLKLCDQSIFACVLRTPSSPERGDCLKKYRKYCIDTFTIHC